MSPMPREPPDTRATLPSMEKRFDIGGPMPRGRAEGKGRSPGRPARAPLQSPPASVSGRGTGRRAHGGGREDGSERPLSLWERPEVQALLPPTGRSARAAPPPDAASGGTDRTAGV